MSLMPVLIREPDPAALTLSERMVYAVFIAEVEAPTSAVRAILRTQRRTGVSRRRVAEIIRKANPEYPV
jgi:hypothetical protein